MVARVSARAGEEIRSAHAADDKPASMATTTGVLCRLWCCTKLVVIGRIVVVSGVLPSWQLISTGTPPLGRHDSGTPLPPKGQPIGPDRDRNVRAGFPAGARRGVPLAAG